MTVNKNQSAQQITDFFSILSREVGKGYIVDFIEKTLRATDPDQRSRNYEMLRASAEATAQREPELSSKLGLTLDFIQKAKSHPESEAGILLGEISQQIKQTLDSRTTLVHRQPS